VAVKLDALHASLAAVAAGGGFALVLSGGWAAMTRKAAPIRTVLLVRRVALIAVVLAALSGAIQLVTGHPPRVGIHYLYAFFALAAVPLATTMAARNPRRGGWYHCGAGLLLLLMCFRLSLTG
jgi:hypothetical protein